MSEQHPQYLISITAPPALEEALVDWLLSRENGEGFTSFAVNGHGRRSEHFSLAEQVAGRQGRIRFQILVPGEACKPLLERLKKDFGGAGLHYWVLPVIEGGEIGPQAG